ncbi:MAG TPA: excinuclease ABC subunit UvrC, partial [Acidimicrobiales bacterium]|nr:excinuclease ABC subunit UvrC [Acidimicrobiales bacterium]
VDFLSGNSGRLERELEAEMRTASRALEFERASILRDRLDAVRAADAVRQMELSSAEDLDVVAIAGDELEAAVQIFHVRSGKVVGRQGLFVDRAEDLTAAELVARILVDVYADAPAGVPRQVLVPEMPADEEVVVDYLVERRGAPVSVRVPARGRKRALLQTVEQNAHEAFVRHRLQRMSDHNSRARAIEALQRELGLPEAPLRIECYDMSHLQGSDYVGSMVVFEDGLPKKADYRHFRVSTVAGNDDYAAMEEVLTRRLRTLVAEESGDGDRVSPEETPGRGPVRRFAYPPQLLLLDGGIGQLNVGVRVLEQLGLTDRISVAALAKSFEEVYRPGGDGPLRLPRQSEALYLLQQLRDEAHRFAVSYHRTLRGRRMTVGALDGVPGLGPKRRIRLVEQFGGLAGLRNATRDELLGVSWLPATVGAAVFERLHAPMPAARGTVRRADTATGAQGVAEEVS